MPRASLTVRKGVSSTLAIPRVPPCVDFACLPFDVLVDQPEIWRKKMQRATASEHATVRSYGSAEAITRALLRCGIVAGPLYIVAGAIQLVIRPGFDVRYNMLSQMALGDLGWIQVTNFVVSGLLVVASAVGIRRALRSGPGSTWGPTTHRRLRARSHRGGDLRR